MKKKILLIGLRYHTYTDDIMAALRGQGHEVTYHDIQPRDLLMKTLRVTAPSWYRSRLDRHHERIVQATEGQQYDLVLFIQVHQMAPSTLQQLRRQQADSEFVLYNWDSLSNHDYRNHLPLFDRAYTFDPMDAQALGIHYLPLFCVPAFLGLAKRQQQQRAIYFVGNIVSIQRYRAIQAFKAHCREQGITFHSYLACTPYVLTLLLRAGHWPADVSLRSIDHQRFIAMIETSVAVFDFANHKQTGYTMRTMENLCAGKKIVTGNPRIAGEAFYSADRILVFDGHDFSQVKAFLQVPLQDPDANFPQFHLDTFVSRLAQPGDSPQAVARSVHR